MTYSSIYHICKFADVNGTAKAVREFHISQSTIRGLQKQMESQTIDQETLPNKPRGRPAYLTSILETRFQNYRTKLRSAGGIVNRSIVVGAAKELVKSEMPTLMRDSNIDLGPTWAKSFLKRNNYVKRKGTKAARKKPADFDELKRKFLQRINEKVAAGSIPD